MDCDDPQNDWQTRRLSNWKSEIRKGNKLFPHPGMPIPSSSWSQSSTFGDRFIPRRRCLSSNMRNMKFFPNPADESDVDVLNVELWRQREFTALLQEQFDLKERRILVFAVAATDCGAAAETREERSKPTRRPCRDDGNSDWQCRPRFKPSIVAEDSYNMHTAHRRDGTFIIDWSVRDHVATGNGSEVTIWKLQENNTESLPVIDPQALAFSPDGWRLAVGLTHRGFPALELWVDIYNKYTMRQRLHLDDSSVVCIAWNKSGSHLVAGTKCGTLLVFSAPALELQDKLSHSNAPIRMIRFSANQRYFACCDDSVGSVVVYNWSSCVVQMKVRSQNQVRVSFDWHPWNDNAMVVAEECPASIIILNVPQKKIVAFYQKSDLHVTIDSVNFNRMTAELMVSISKFSPQDEEESRVLILSALDRIVDVIVYDQEYGARFLVSSPDGSRVATYGRDGSMTVWTFCNAASAATPATSTASSQRPKDQLGATRDCPHLSLACFGNQFRKWSFIK